MKTTIVAMLAVLLMLTACFPKQSGIKQAEVAIEQGDVMARVPIPKTEVNVEDCWTVYEIEPGGNPHIQVPDEFCTEYVNSVFVLTPGTGMTDWSPCAPETVIVLHHVGGGVTYRFCAHVNPHVGGPGKDHMNFQIIFMPEVAGKQKNMIIAIGGGVGSSAHGGTAHSQN